MHTLLLNYNYEPLNFCSERRVFCLWAKDKIEVLATWEAAIKHGRDGTLPHPAIARLKYQVRWIPKFGQKYSSEGVFRRDQFCCGYCLKALTNKTATIDHVIPRALGGESSWKNCITACFPCNGFKRNRTPEQANMKLLWQPGIPESSSLKQEMRTFPEQHPDWQFYFRS